MQRRKVISLPEVVGQIQIGRGIPVRPPLCALSSLSPSVTVFILRLITEMNEVKLSF